jgi:hypothetical protein
MNVRVKPHGDQAPPKHEARRTAANIAKLPELVGEAQ